MKNLPPGEKNVTDFECGFCLDPLLFNSAVMPYILISLPANSWVLWLMKSSPVFWTDRMDVSEFHLVLTELLFGFLGPPLMIISFYFNTEMIQTVSKVINTIFTARIQFQCSVCIERYLAVVHPLLYLRYKPLRYRMSFCCVIWLQSILPVLAEMYVCNRITMGIYTTCVVFVFIINSFCSISVLRALKQPSPGEGEKERSNLVKRRAFNIVLIFQMTTIVGYVPLITVFYLAGKLDRNILCIWQPLTYALMIWLGGFYALFYLRRAGKLTRNHLFANCFKHSYT